MIVAVIVVQDDVVVQRAVASSGESFPFDVVTVVVKVTVLVVVSVSVFVVVTVTVLVVVTV